MSRYSNDQAKFSPPSLRKKKYLGTKLSTLLSKFLSTFVHFFLPFSTSLFISNPLHSLFNFPPVNYCVLSLRDCITSSSDSLPTCRMSYLYTLLLPALLLTGAVLRDNLLGFLCTLSFVLNVTWTPHRELSSRRTFARILVTVLFVFFLLVCLGHVTFQILYHLSILTSQQQIILLTFFGFPKVTTLLNGLRYIAPDPILLITTSILLRFQSKSLFSSRTNQQSFTTLPRPKPPIFNAALVFCALFVAGISYPSLPQLIYFIAFLSILALKSFFRRSFLQALNLFWIPLYVVNVVHILLISIFQISFISSGFIQNIQEVFGVLNLRDLHWNLQNVSLLVGWGSAVLLFILLSYKFKMLMLAKEAASRLVQEDRDYSSHLKDQLIKRERNVHNFFRNNVWKIAILGAIGIALFIQSLLSLLLLFTVLICSILPQHFLEKYKIISLILGYFLLSILLQYFYNLPFGFPQSQTLRDIGFRVYDAIWIWIGLQCLCAYLIGLACIHQHRMTQVEEPRQEVKRESEKEKLIVSDDEGEEGEDGERKERRLKRRQTMALRREPSLVSFWQTTRFEAFKNVIRMLWYTILKHSYKLSLAGLYFICLTSVNLINAGYMLIFIVFVLSSKIALRCWLLLVLYCSAVIALIYFWNFSWTSHLEENFWTNLIGLQHYSNYNLVFQGLLWHLIIFLFSVIQWRLIVYVRQIQASEEQTKSVILPRWFNLIIGFLNHCEENYGLLFCYIALVCVALFTSLSLVNILYLIFVFSCLCCHMKSSRAYYHIKKFWVFIVILAGLVLVARYVFQFEIVSSWLESIFPRNQYISLTEIGLEVYENFLFFNLLGNSVVFLVTVIQFRTFFGKRGDYIDEYNVFIESFTRLVELRNFCKRFLILHSNKITAIVIFIVSLWPICAMHGLYVVLLVAIPCTAFVNKFGFFFLLYSMLLILAQLCYQLPARVFIPNPGLMEWIGFRTDTSYFRLVYGYLLIIFCLLMGRFARRWRREFVADFESVPTDAYISIVEEKQEEEKSEQKEQFIQRPMIEITLFLYEDEFKPASDGNFHRREFVQGTKWYLSNFFKILHEPIFILMLLIAAYVRFDVLGLCYLFIAGIFCFLPYRFLENSRIVFALLICAEIIVCLQYFFNLGFPSGVSENYFPWENLSIDWQVWLALRVRNNYLLLTDFFILLTLARIRRLFRDSLSAFKNSSYWKNIIDCNSKLEDFTVKPRLWRNSARYYFYRYSIYVILIVLFIVGTVTKNVLSLIYLVFALLYLYGGQILFQKRDTLWRWVRYYNFLVIVTQIVFQAPFMPSNANPESVQQILGLSKVGDTLFSFMIFHYIIFILFSFQNWLFHRPEFDLVLEKITLDQEIAVERAKKRLLEDSKKIEEDFEKIREEQKRRKEQLQTLKICRQRQQELWRFVEHPIVSSQAPVSVPSLQSMPHVQQFQQPPPIQTTADIKRLQEIGALQIQTDETQHGLKLKFQTHETTTTAQLPSSPTSSEVETKPELKSEVFVPLTIEEKREVQEDKGESPSDSESEASSSSSSSSDENDDTEDNKKGEDTTKSTELSSDKPKSQPKLKKIFDAFVDALIKFLSRWTSTKEKRLEDLNKSRRQKIIIGIKKLLQNNSKWICFIWFMIMAVNGANILSLILPISMFLYAILEKPRPHKNYWHFVLIYLDLLIIVKFIFQLSVFCICETEDGDIWSLQPQCQDKSICGFVNNGVALTTPEIFGIVPIPGPFIFGIFFEFAAVIIVLFHCHNLKKHGLWNTIDFEAPSTAEDKIEATKQIKRAEAKLKKRKEKWRSYEIKVLQKKIRKLRKKKEKEGLSPSEQSLLQQAEIQLERLQSQEPIVPSSPLSERKDSRLEGVHSPRKTDDGDTQVELESSFQEDEQAQIEKELKEERSCGSKFRRFGFVIKDHFKSLIFRQKEVGKDLYVPLFIVELLCFFFVVIFPGDFTGSNASGVGEFLTENRLPTSYVIVLLCQFILIVIDRIVFLYRSLLLKLIMHYSLTIFYHVWLLFVIPQQNNRRFHESPTLVVIYILKLIYLFISGVQIMYGYPYIVQSRFLTDSEHPGMIRQAVFMIYRAIPFLWELKTLLDWATTKTALTFYEWLKLEDLYDDLFLVHARIESERNTERRVGDPQPWYMKLFVGGGLFIVLCFVIWFPLLIMMQGAPGNRPNYVRELTVTFAIEGFDPLYRTLLPQTSIQQNVSQEYFNELRNKFTFVLPDDRDNIQIMTFDAFSGRQWSITPPALARLRKMLSPNDTTEINLTWEFNFRRDNPPQLLVLTVKQSRVFTPEMKQNLLEVLNGANTTFNVTSFFPRFYRLPVDGQVIIPSENEYVNCLFRLREDILEFNFTNNNETVSSRQVMVFWETLENNQEHTLFPSREINIVTISNVLPTGLVGTFVMTAGIIGLYVGVVLAIGRFLRISVTLLYTRIMFEDMPECDEIISYCKDIFLARQDGDLVLEEELYRELIELYRSPERLILRTLPKRPRFKEPKPKEKTE